MTLTLYRTDSEVNKMYKSLSGAYQMTGTLKDAANILSPDIKCELNATYLDRNYAYIPEFGRYYFIKDKTIEGQNLVTLHLQVDVLMTYADVVSREPMLIERSEGGVNEYLADSMRPIFNYPMTLTKKFPNSFDAFNFYLTVNGK